MAKLSMDSIDAKTVLSAIVNDLFDKYFPDLKEDSNARGIILAVYLDFVTDKTGYWTSVKTSVLITGHLNLREKKSSPAHTVQVILEWAIKTMELIAENHRKDNKVISFPLPDPEIRRFFQPPDVSFGNEDQKPNHV